MYLQHSIVFLFTIPNTQHTAVSALQPCPESFEVECLLDSTITFKFIFTPLAN